MFPVVILDPTEGKHTLFKGHAQSFSPEKKCLKVPNMMNTFKITCHLAVIFKKFKVFKPPLRQGHVKLGKKALESSFLSTMFQKTYFSRCEDIQMGITTMSTRI